VLPNSHFLLGDRPTAGQQALDLLIGVRIPVPQPLYLATFCLTFPKPQLPCLRLNKRRQDEKVCTVIFTFDFCLLFCFNYSFCWTGRLNIVTSKNCYEDPVRAKAYDKLEFSGTYYLAFRDLAEIIFKHSRGKNAIDFGCGTGRSTRFLKRYGFRVIGVDISKDMLEKATANDPEGDYRLIDQEGLASFGDDSYDLVLSAFTFDNIPKMETKVALLRQMRRVVKREGIIVNLVSAPEIYAHEWASFSTKDFPENHFAKSGDAVKIIVTDIEDRRPVEDTMWSDESYQDVYKQAGLKVPVIYRPLGREDERIHWINETRIAPWVIYVLRK
jgi:ubiquinone/menaquinone biosynthesis C-methylase UbiE